jgi:(p)ppGpp synthase/HD superfamily hydrolase
MGVNIIEDALEHAARAHSGQLRKGTKTPYIVHPVEVGIMLIKSGFSDEITAAGILHDTVEDTGTTLEYIRQNFGEAVAKIVEGCSEPDKSLSWEERKEHTLEYLKTAPIEVKIVSCADKLNNLRSMAVEFNRIGDDVYKRFRRGAEKQRWYFSGLVKSLCSEQTMEYDIFRQFKKEVEEFFG